MYRQCGKRFIAGAALGACCYGSLVSAQNSDDSAGKQNVETLDTIVVEASKTGSELKDVNGAVQVFTAEELKQAGITTVQDISTLVPGLVIELRGNSTYSGNTLRGVSSPNFYSPSVSVYVDGVLQDNTFVMQELVNVKAVEVLKGPQGTLYGGNSHGGIINIVTYKGAPDFVGEADVALANIRKEGRFSVLAPLGNGLSASAAVTKKITDGIIDHTGTGTGKADSIDNTSGALGLFYEPSNGPFSARLNLRLDKLDSHEEFYLTEKEFDDKKTAPISFLVPKVPELKRDVQALSLALGYKLNDQMTLESITSSQKRTVDRNFVGGEWQEDQDMVSQELRLSYRMGAGSRAVVGVYYEQKQWDQDANIPLRNPPGAIFNKKNTLKTTSLAVFGDATFALSSSVDVSAGLRYGVDKAEIDYKVPIPGGSFQDSRDDNILLPKIGAGLKLTDNLRLYGSASAGYRPAGFNNNPSGPIEKAGYDAELSRNFELGLKGTGADSRFRFGTALYFIELEDVQVNTGVQPTQILENLGNAVSRGVEFDMSYAAKGDPDTNVSFGINIGKAQFTGGNEKAGLKDKKLQYSPETSGNFGVQVAIPQSAIKGKIIVGSNVTYKSKFYFDENNTVFQGDYALVDAQIKYQTTGGLGMRIFAENLTDRKYARYKFNSGTGQQFGVWGRPRTVGIGVSAIF